MISSVRGTVLEAGVSRVIIEVGGVGLDIVVTPAHALRLRVGTEATLRTALIVREDDLSLYGFADADERAVFDLLRGVTGVGPKSAMGVLAVMEPADIATAVAAENDAAFRKVSGIGPKTAKLIVLSLSGKMQGITARTPGKAGPTAAGDSVLAALIGLGWSERVAADAIDDAMAAATTGDVTVSSLLRSALGRLGPGQHSSGQLSESNSR
ncbi:MAG: Holliday junction branch migration protein RuvA [Terrimesophilobacter sp.]